MGVIMRALAQDGSALCYVMESTDIVERMRTIHACSPTVTAALGRLLTGASIMGSMMKGTDDTLTLRMNGGGGTGSLIAVSDSFGNVRGYAENAGYDLPRTPEGKLDVGGAVGKDGTLHVMRDLGLAQPYIGNTELVSGEVAEDITHYYAVSEQVPTVCALGVLVNRENGSVLAAGGFIAQLLPGHTEEAIDLLERNIKNLEPVSHMILKGMQPQEISAQVLSGFAAEETQRSRVLYRCDCTRERVERALLSLGSEELLQMSNELPVTEVDCHFCPKKYRFSPDELRNLVQQASI